MALTVRPALLRHAAHPPPSPLPVRLPWQTSSLPDGRQFHAHLEVRRRSRHSASPRTGPLARLHLGYSVTSIEPRPASELPGPPGSWLTGNLAAYEADRLGFLDSAAATYGDLVKFGPRTTIVNNADVARQVLKGDDGAFQISQDFMQRPLNATQVATVLRVRPHLDPGLRPTAISPFEPTIRAIALDELGNTTAPAPFDVMPSLEVIAARVVTTYYFGEDADRVRHPVAALLDQLSKVIGNLYALPASVSTIRRRRIRRQHLTARSEVEHQLQRRAKHPERFDDAATAMLTNVGRRTTEPLTRIADLIVGALMAGYRVPAASMAWTLMLLADHVDVQTRLVRDVRTSHDRLSSNEPSRSTTYLDACVLESLRLFPPTWLITRTCARPVTLSGYRFPAGHTMLVSPWTLHRDERHFASAHTFAPERWLDPVLRRSNAFMPFGYGPHACPGNNLTHAMSRGVVGAVLSERWVGRAPGRVVPDARTTLLPVGLELNFSTSSADSTEPRQGAYAVARSG